MSFWYDRLTEIREQKKLQQKDIADKMGIDYTAYNRYERGKTENISRTLYKKLLLAFSQNEVDYIKTGEYASSVNETPIEYGKECENMVTVPYHKDVYASAGGGSNATSMVDTNPITFSKMFLNSYLGVYDLQGLSMINAAGDSMDPTIKSGAIMFVYPMESEGFKDGSIYVLMCGDALLVKRVSLDPVTKVYTLLSDNGKVNAIKLTIDEASDCHFVGRVVGHLDRV